jgi:glyoxylase-like metal-dependent hydrolase (beta-lactamase superfamily II)
LRLIIRKDKSLKILDFDMLPSNLHFIQRGWFNSNHILITGEAGAVLVDTGHRQDVAETLRLIEGAGVDPASIRLIVNTHCHWDHCGGNEAIQAVSEAAVIMSEETAALFQTNDRRAMWLDYFGAEMVMITADFTLHDGDEIKLADLLFQVIAAPGHAPDAIALYQPQHRLLICADALLENGDCGILNTAVHGPQILDKAIATVEKFAQLEAAVALPGHGRMIIDVPGNIVQLRQRLAAFKAEPARMAWHLLRRVFMTYLMLVQPIWRHELIVQVVQTPWLQDYAPQCQLKPELLAQQIIDEFIQRNLAREEEGMLVSLVPR